MEWIMTLNLMNTHSEWCLSIYFTSLKYNQFIEFANSPYHVKYKTVWKCQIFWKNILLFLLFQFEPNVEWIIKTGMWHSSINVIIDRHSCKNVILSDRVELIQNNQ